MSDAVFAFSQYFSQQFVAIVVSFVPHSGESEHRTTTQTGETIHNDDDDGSNYRWYEKKP